MHVKTPIIRHAHPWGPLFLQPSLFCSFPKFQSFKESFPSLSHTDTNCLPSFLLLLLVLLCSLLFLHSSYCWLGSPSPLVLCNPISSAMAGLTVASGSSSLPSLQILRACLLLILVLVVASTDNAKGVDGKNLLKLNMRSFQEQKTAISSSNSRSSCLSQRSSEFLTHTKEN